MHLVGTEKMVCNMNLFHILKNLDGMAWEEVKNASHLRNDAVMAEFF
jgi:hypothetical protein